MESKRIIVVVGPTASGKSDFAVALAKELDGEIISADSRQVYKHLDLGTGKITKEEMQGVIHHMLSVYDLDEAVSVARYARDASPILEDILARNKTPIICGGTGQYIDALIYTSTLPKVPPNPSLRELLEKETTAELFKRLEQKDKRRANDIDQHNRVRIMRSLEIIDTLGAVPQQEVATLRYPTQIYLMNPSRETLRKRVTLRLSKRLKEGMIEEVESLLKKGYDKVSMKKFGLEYDIISQYLRKEIAKEQMEEILITKTMQYAKRQQTWNKKYEKIAKKVDII